MGEQLKGEATAHLQDDSTFVLKPIMPPTPSDDAQDAYLNLCAFRKANQPIPTTNTNLKEGEVVNLADYEEATQYKNLTNSEVWSMSDFNMDGFTTRTVLVLKEKKEPFKRCEPVNSCKCEKFSDCFLSDSLKTPTSVKLSPLSDERDNTIDLRTLLIQAANFGQDFGAANAWTLQYDSIENMIDSCFENEIRVSPHLKPIKDERGYRNSLQYTNQ